MTTVHDVAAQILSQLGPMRSMKFEKLNYYSQAWHLAWCDEPLFGEPIQAFVRGPIVRALFNRHKGADVVRRWNGNPDNLSDRQKQTIYRVLSFYGQMSGDELSLLTHTEKPWVDARVGLAPNQPGSREITHEAMKSFYRRASTLLDSDDVQMMCSNLVRKLEDGTWGMNRAHPQPLYLNYAAKLVAPFVVAEGTAQ